MSPKGTEAIKQKMEQNHGFITLLRKYTKKKKSKITKEVSTTSYPLYLPCMSQDV